jgi:hypothetical protein
MAGSPFPRDEIQSDEFRGRGDSVDAAHCPPPIAACISFEPTCVISDCRGAA